MARAPLAFLVDADRPARRGSGGPCANGAPARRFVLPGLALDAPVADLLRRELAASRDRTAA